jgi:hypothetical protein
VSGSSAASSWALPYARQARCPPVRTLGVRRPHRSVLDDQRRRAGAERGGRSHRAGTTAGGSHISAAAGRSPPWPPQPAGGGRVAAEPATAPGSAVCCCCRTRPGVRTAADDRGPCGQDYRKSSSLRSQPMQGRKRRRQGLYTSLICQVTRQAKCERSRGTLRAAFQARGRQRRARPSEPTQRADPASRPSEPTQMQRRHRHYLSMQRRHFAAHRASA